MIIDRIYLSFAVSVTENENNTRQILCDKARFIRHLEESIPNDLYE